MSVNPTSSYIDSQYVNGNTFTNIKDLYDNAVASTSGLRFNAIGPGKYGDNYAISIITSADTLTPATSAFVDWKNAYDTDPSDVNAKWRKIFKVMVFVKNDADSWTTLASKVSGTPDEVYYCSTDYTLVDNNGGSMFVEDVINGRSSSVYVKSGITNGTIPSSVNVRPLTGGADSTLSTEVDSCFTKN